jgi:hypothetical protein
MLRKLRYNGLGMRLVPGGELVTGQVIEVEEAAAAYLLSLGAGFADETDAAPEADLPAAAGAKTKKAKAPAPGAADGAEDLAQDPEV